jgi:hypothetical protein
VAWRELGRSEQNAAKVDDFVKAWKPATQAEHGVPPVFCGVAVAVCRCCLSFVAVVAWLLLLF